MSTVIVPYISCIKLRGSPILPPVMDAVRRKEMQQYRDQALCIEKRLLYSKRVSTDSGLGTVTSYETAAGRDTTIFLQRNCGAVVDDPNLNMDDCSSSNVSDIDDTLLQQNERNFPQSDAEFTCQHCTSISNQLVVESHTDDEMKRDRVASEASEITVTSNAHVPDKENDHENNLDSSAAMSASTDLNQYVDMSLTSSPNSTLACEQQECILPVSELLPLSVSGLKLQHKSLITCEFDTEESKQSSSTEHCGETNSDHGTVESKQSSSTEQCGETNSDHGTVESKLSSSTEQCGDTTTSTVVPEPTRPRLVRSNSYTLEAPSPVLLAHVEQAKRNCLSRDSLLPYQKSCAKSPDKDIATKFVFVGTRPVKDVSTPQEVAVHNKLSTSLPSSTSTSPVKMKSPYASTECVPHKFLPLKRKRSSNDSSSNTRTTPDSFSFSQSFDSSNHTSPSDGICGAQGGKDIRLLFLELQSKYEKEKAELLARQKREQDEMEMLFQNQCEQLVAAITRQWPQVLAVMQSSAPISPVTTQLQTVKTISSPRAPSTNRQLFTYSEAEHKAASIIQAAVRGYMVRRLMKTERVLNLKATILDTVKCALRLEQDCQKEVTPADVEFHRGLIIQLNAAILEFHQLFFSTNIVERMDIIASDRLRLRKQFTRSTSSQCAVSAATKKYQKRKSRDGSSEDSSRPNSCRSFERMCLSGKNCSRTNSVASFTGSNVFSGAWRTY